MFKKVILYSLLLPLVLSASNDKDSKNKGGNTNKSNLEFFDGLYLGIGPSIKVYNASESMDSKSCRESYQTNFTSYGVHGGFGFLKRLSGNFFWGAEAGITYCANSNAKFNGNLSAESVFIQNELNTRDVLREMLHSIGNNLASVSIPIVGNNIVLAANKDKFIKVIRFIGGENINIKDNFLTDPAAPGLDQANTSLKNFIGNDSWAGIAKLGNGDIASGLEKLRDFVENQYPIVAASFRRFAENAFNNRGGVPVANTNLGGIANWDDSVGDVLASIFLGQKQPANINAFEQFGVNPANMAGMTFDDFQDDIGRIHFPTDADTAALLQNREVIRNQVKTKITLGVCPHVAMKFAYYFPELHGLGFIKVGAIQLNGTLRPEVDSIKVGRETLFIPEEKFRKVAPLVGAGYAGTIRGTNFGYSVEISHAFRVNKHMQKIQSAGGVTVDNRTSISYTAINFSFIFKFN